MNVELKFEDAVELARRGELIARPSWDKSVGVVFYRPEDQLPSNMIPNIKSIPQSLKDYIGEDSKYLEYIFTGYLCRYTNGTIVNGWFPTEDERKASDWYVVK